MACGHHPDLTRRGLHPRLRRRSLSLLAEPSTIAQARVVRWVRGRPARVTVLDVVLPERPGDPSVATTPTGWL
jgi:hypothetical protein